MCKRGLEVHTTSKKLKKNLRKWSLEWWWWSSQSQRNSCKDKGISLSKHNQIKEIKTLEWTREWGLHFTWRNLWEKMDGRDPNLSSKMVTHNEFLQKNKNPTLSLSKCLCMEMKIMEQSNIGRWWRGVYIGLWTEFTRLGLSGGGVVLGWTVPTISYNIFFLTLWPAVVQWPRPDYRSTSSEVKNAR